MKNSKKKKPIVNSDRKLMKKEKVLREIRKNIKGIPVEKLENKKQIRAWFNDESQDY